MGLDPGTKLGPYEIVAPMGAGGIGQITDSSCCDGTVAVARRSGTNRANEHLCARGGERFASMPALDALKLEAGLLQHQLYLVAKDRTPCD